jgi:hypothetical protein
MGKYKKGGALWTKEEKMAYLDWDKAEDDRIDGIVREDVEANGFGTRRRGRGQLWAEADRDIEEQNHICRTE